MLTEIGVYEVKKNQDSGLVCYKIRQRRPEAKISKYVIRLEKKHGADICIEKPEKEEARKKRDEKDGSGVYMEVRRKSKLRRCHHLVRREDEEPIKRLGSTC